MWRQNQGRDSRMLSWPWPKSKRRLKLTHYPAYETSQSQSPHATQLVDFCGRVTVQFESFRKLKHTTCRRWRFVQRFRNILYVLASVACAQHQTGWIFGTSGFTQTCWRHTTLMLSLRTCHVFLITGHVEEMNEACYPCPCIFMHWLLALNSISIYRAFNILYIE